MTDNRPDARLQDRVFRLALVVLLMATIVWLGASIMRLMLWSELLKPGTLQFEDYIPPRRNVRSTGCSRWPRPTPSADTCSSS